MRIAVLSRHFSRSSGGAESYAVALVQGMVPCHDVHVFSQESDQPVAGVTYHTVLRLFDRPRWLNQLVFSFSTWFQTRHDYDLVHSHENTWHGQVQTIHVRPMRRNLFFGVTGVRLFFRWLKVLTSPRLITYLFLEGARFKCAPSRTIVATSDLLRQECEEAYPHCTGIIKEIPPGVKLPGLMPERVVARQALGLPLGGRVILFVANDYARKGLATLLKALALLPSDVSLVVVGNPNAAAKYRPQALQLGIQCRVHFLGSLGNLSPAYAAADCLAHPTLEDSFAMVVLEAMAHGLPVIVSGPEQCGISRQLTHNVNAFLLLDPQDEYELATQVGAVLSDQSSALNLRHGGLAFAKQHTWESAILKYEQIYSQAASH